jgi:2-iminobutanoate/2-iminopropanoate deaminase
MRLSLFPLAAALLALPANAQIQRFKNAAGASPSPILQGALVPAGSDILYLSGQLASPIEASKNKPAAQLTMEDFGDMKTQTISVLNKIKAALEQHGYKLSDCVKALVILRADPKSGALDFAGMNAGFLQFFNTAENPNTVARSAFQAAALAGPNYLVEIEVIAAKAK